MFENNEIKDGKLQLHNWYVTEWEYKGQTVRTAGGVVTGHKRLMDASVITTSKIQKIRVDEENAEAVIITQNSEYHCPLEYCDFDRQDDFPDQIPDYSAMKEKYRGKRPRPSIEAGNVLLVLANFCEYYFHSLYYVPADGSSGGEPLEYTAYPHIGMYQDSFLIGTVKSSPVFSQEGDVDLRYFPHYENIEFYKEDTKEMPLFLENAGDRTLYARTSCGVIKLESGQRKLVAKENAEENPPGLLGGDLYPAVECGEVVLEEDED